MDILWEIISTVRDPSGVFGFDKSIYQNIISDIASFFVFQLFIIYTFIRFWNRKATRALRLQRDWILVEIRDSIARVALEGDKVDREAIIKSLRSRLTLFDHSVPVEGWTSTSQLLDYLERKGQDGLNSQEFSEVEFKFTGLLRDFSVSGADMRRHHFFLSRLSNRLYK